MKAKEDPQSHQVGITNAQEHNHDCTIAEMTCRMNALFERNQHEEAVCVAFQITAMSKEELRQDFERHEVTVRHLDHEVFGIYGGQIEPSYDVHVEGETSDILAAAKEFGKRHAQEMVLIARKTSEGENDLMQRLGLTITLNEDIRIDVAVEIAALVRDCGFQGATFAPKRNGSIAIYHTDSLGLSPQEFRTDANHLITELRKLYKNLQYDVAKYIISMPTL